MLGRCGDTREILLKGSFCWSQDQFYAGFRAVILEWISAGVHFAIEQSRQDRPARQRNKSVRRRGGRDYLKTKNLRRARGRRRQTRVNS
jgi:hypothetical protein